MSTREYKWRELGRRLKHARARTRLTQQKVAEHFGVQTQTVWYWESGRSKPDHYRLPILAELYGVTVDWLLAGDETNTPWTVAESATRYGDSSAEDPSFPDADRELVMNEASLALRSVSKELSDEAIKSIADFIRFVHEKEQKEQRER